ncbi:RHS repeat-associated core domain-containing protein [Streptomyces triticirhizae]|uniref:RHS repeat-associated core domain-containing protein n=1 Tax=Streptomyces triticirhizae TaxID=2483353 RepID=UPI001F33FB08|nr:RHS repeat-associated core domain-containing protein [Streptomyces triticirhizae]
MAVPPSPLSRRPAPCPGDLLVSGRGRYNHHRHYDPRIGRYTSPDPLGLVPAPTPYTYAHNPHTFVDPLGLAAHVADPNSLRRTHSISGDSSSKRVKRLRDAMRGGDFDWDQSPISVVRGPDDAMYVVDGHHRLNAASGRGWRR